MARVIRRAGGLAVRVFVARRAGDNELVGLLPVALTRSLLFGTYATSLPYVNCGGVLHGDEVAAKLLVATAWRWARGLGARDLVLRHTDARPLPLPASRRKHTVTLRLPQGDADALWSSIGSKTRNLVRRAQRMGCSAAEVGRRGLRGFHDVYTRNMRDLGSPGMGQGFFSVLAEELGGAMEVHHVRHAGAVVGAAVVLRFKGRFEVPWASCLRSSRSVAANMLLYWHLLEHATRTGAQLFDFGRSTPGSGPHRFKLQWGGAVSESLPWYQVSREGALDDSAGLSPDNPRFAGAIGLWRRLPVPLTRVIGSRLAVSLP
jgi:FemAB-related protein (PEP-CTERM system-associated)